GYSLLKDLITSGIKNNFRLNIVYGDASKTLFSLKNNFDIIFFDPFSKSKNPEMWNINIYKRLYTLLSDDGVVVTYACSKIIRREFEEAGFKTYPTPNLPKDFQPGTILRK
ncbi:MAG: hypothetical protein H5U39_09195, partial [Deferribacterales bacterium]|nr:hypothetical protein [Deferribacterales bacterium]